MLNYLIVVFSLFAIVLAPMVYAFPIASTDTEGFEVIVNTTSHVVATYQGNSASYSNDLYLMLDAAGEPGDDGNPSNDRFVLNNHSSPEGSTVDLGSFPIGTELIFRMHVNNTNTDYFTGPANRNPDNYPHARVQQNWQSNESLVSFEDLFNGAFIYNDLSVSLTNTQSRVVANCNPAAKLTTPDSAFTLNGNGTTLHTPTQLMWMRCSLGQSWDGTTCTGSAAEYNWPQALQVATTTSFAGYSDWRLPNIRELRSIVEYGCYKSINITAFPNTPASYFWSSSPFASGSSAAWIIYLSDGNDYDHYKSNSAYVRLVRGGQ